MSNSMLLCTSPWLRNAILRHAAAMLGCLVGFAAHADTTTLSAVGASKGTSNAPETILFQVMRNGDISYDAVVDYRTVDGTAAAGVDYTAASGTITVSAGSASASIPIILAAHPGNGAALTFQLSLDAATGVGPAPTFATSQTFATGSGPYMATVADINGDGKPDVIAVNLTGNAISVLLNSTAAGAVTPSFVAQQTFATGMGVRYIAIADVNGDGKPDVIVANFSDNTVSVLLNTTAPGSTTASFATQQTFATGSEPFSVTAGDINGDGKPDLIVANYDDNTVSVLLNTTTPGATVPSFATQQTFAAGALPVSVATADVNGDGRADLIVSNRSDNNVSVLLNATVPGATTASFASQKTFAAGMGASSVIAADINGDGKADLIVTNLFDDTVSVLLNSTTPGAAIASFVPQQTFATGGGPLTVSAVDVNGDGKLDLIIANHNDTTVSVLLNTTAPGAALPTFRPQQTVATGSNPYSATPLDINGDGKLDLVVANYFNNTISVLLNTSVPGTSALSFAGQQTFATNLEPIVTTADVNGDGKPDLIVATGPADSVSVLLNTTAPGAATPSFAAPQAFDAGSFPEHAIAADVNGDGMPDLIAVNYGDNTISVLLNTTVPGATTLSFAQQQVFATGSIPTFVAVADINEDGRPDLIVANSGDNTVSVLLNTTAPGATTPHFAAQQTFAVGSTPARLAAVDLNGDGKSDLIVANDTSNSISVLINTTAPGGPPSFAAQQTFATGTNPTSVAAVDVNGDGKPDLVFTNSGDNTVSVRLNTTASGGSTLSFAGRQNFATGSNPTSLVAADVDGDGRPDLIVANNESSNVSVFINTTTGGAVTPSFAGQRFLSSGRGPGAVTATDVNGDGKPDLILGNIIDNTISVLLNTQYQSVVTGGPATGTIVHDYIFASGFE